MSICCSKSCKKYRKCKQSEVKDDYIHTSRDYANSFEYKDGIIIGYHCGERGGYKYFKPRKEKTNEQA